MKKITVIARMMLVAAVVLATAMVSCGKGEQSNFADQIPARPTPTTLINDLATALQDSTWSIGMEDSLKALNAATGKNMVIVTVKELPQGVGASYYAQELAKKWELGDDAIVVLIKPQDEQGGAQVAFEVGANLQQSFPQGLRDQIVNEKIGQMIATTHGKYNKALWAAIHEVKTRIAPNK